MESLEEVLRLELEQALREVKRLKRDLSAEIVIQEEKGHWEEFVEYETEYETRFEYEFGIPAPREGERWVVDKERITKPDIQKRELAKKKLQKIYKSSKWYSVRYLAGRVIGISKNILAVQLGNWILELVEKQKETTIIWKEVEVQYREEAYDPKKGYYGGSQLETFTRREKKPFERPSENALRAREDLRYLYENLPDRKQRIRIGKLLGISEADILGNELVLCQKLEKSQLELVYESAFSYKHRKIARKSAGLFRFKNLGA